MRYSSVDDSRANNAPLAAAAAPVTNPIPFAAILPAFSNPDLSLFPRDSPDLVTFLNLEEPISLWVDTLLSFKENPNRQVQDLIVKKFIEKCKLEKEKAKDEIE